MRCTLVRSFSERYLQQTRRELWHGSRAALSGLELPHRECVLELGCGTGELTQVLAEETSSSTTIIAVDGDRTHLPAVRPYATPVQADARRLPFAADSVDLAVCQALLVNLRTPVQAVTEFKRVSTGLVGAIEPDNSAVSVTSTVDDEAQLAARARDAFVAGIPTDPTLGSQMDQVFATAGLTDIHTTCHEYTRTVEAPYSDAAITAARRQATGAGLAADRETLLADSLTPSEYDQLRAHWRRVGREIVDQMQAGTYLRRETIPLYVTVGTVSPD